MPNVTFQPPKKEKLTGILAIVLYLVTGVLLLVKPEWMMDFTRFALCAALMGYAALSFRKYLNTPAEEAAKGYGLTGAMIAATLSVLALFEVSIPMEHIWGVLLLAGGYMKFQTGMDMGRLGHQRWWLFMVPCAVSLVFGILILTEVIRTNSALFIGIALIVEGLVDIAAMIMTARSDKLNQKLEKQKKEEESAKVSEEQPAEKKEETSEEKASESSES